MSISSRKQQMIDEQAEVVRLRNNGLTLDEIAHHFSKSIGWVNSRINPRYKPKKLRRAEDDAGAAMAPLPSGFLTAGATGRGSLIIAGAGESASITLSGEGTEIGCSNDGIPASIKALMTEINTAVQNKLYKLAAMGIRATLENIMKEKIGDRPFVVLVAEFQKSDYLSARQTEILNSIIEAGHAVIHRAWQPNADDISLFIDVTETLIKTVYLHEDRARELSLF
jgi:hypothetical protein